MDAAAGALGGRAGMNAAEKFKTLMDTGEFDFINEIPKENLWKLLFLVAFTYNEIKKEGDKNG